MPQHRWVQDAAERRSVRRVAEIDCEVVAEEGFRLLSRRGLNVSAEGLLVQSDQVARLGESVLVSLRAPGSRSWLDGEATVVRLVRGRRSVCDVPALGLKFRHLDAVSQAILSGSLRGLPPPVPARPLRRDYAGTILRIALSSYTNPDAMNYGTSN